MIYWTEYDRKWLCRPSECSKIADYIITPQRWNAAMVDDRWISVEEVAAYLGVKRDTIYKWINRRNMPAHKVGRLWKFRKKEVDQWIHSGGASKDNNREN